MNREQIIAKWNTLTPRERDAWVAKVIMRYEWYVPDYDEPTGWYMQTPHTDTFADFIFTGKGADWSPTTDISSAWTIVEYLRKYWLVQIRDCDVFGWVIDLLSDSEYRTDIGGIHAQKVEEAICLAAILAKLNGRGNEYGC